MTRRRLLLVWLISVIGAVAVVAIQHGPVRHRMEDDLALRSARALAAAGSPPVEVAFTGRDGVLRAADEATATRAREIVSRVEGVRIVRTVVPPEAEPVRLAAPSLRVTVAGGRVALAGTVSGAADHALLRDAAAEGLAVVDDRIAVGQVSDRGLATLPPFLAALPRDAEDLTVRVESGVLTLTGTARSEVEWVAVTEGARRTGFTVVDDLAVADLGEQLADVPPLLFPSGSAWLSPQAVRNLWRTAGLLAANPSATVRIEGHTDAAEASAPLSRERAAAVRDVLVSFGIAEDRLTIVGYADARPAGTDDGRARDRRAELAVT